MLIFASIPAGQVTLNDARRGVQRTVALMPYQIATTTISAAEFNAGRPLPNQDGELPAVGLTWLDAITWCNSASAAQRLDSVYLVAGNDVAWNPSADGYRLPTEVEWVYACLGGTQGPRYGALAEIGWTAADEVDGPQPTATKKANNYGLFDTLGNVWEWCWDRLDAARYGDYRVLKGGGWADAEWSCRAGVRRGYAPDARVDDVGFRVARGAAAPIGQSDGGQGWSETADRQRASLNGPLPVGWTPLT